MVTGFGGVSSLGSVVRRLGCCRGGFSRTRSVFASPGRCGVPVVEDFEVFEDDVGQHLMRVRHRRRSRSSACVRAQNGFHQRVDAPMVKWWVQGAGFEGLSGSVVGHDVLVRPRGPRTVWGSG